MAKTNDATGPSGHQVVLVQVKDEPYFMGRLEAMFNFFSVKVLGGCAWELTSQGPQIATTESTYVTEPELGAPM